MQFNKLIVYKLPLLIIFCFLLAVSLITKVEHPILLTLYITLYFTFAAILVKISIKISQILAVLLFTDINHQTWFGLSFCTTLNIILVIFLQRIDDFISFENLINILYK